MGIVLSSTVAVVAEVQALWVAAFLTGTLDGDVPVKPKPRIHSPLRMNTLSRKDLDQDISDDVVWGNINGGGLNIDAIHYNDMLLQDLGLDPHRMSGRFCSEMSAIYGPSAYAGIVEEWLEMRER
ncbi:uncharacterized protein ASPGLDRAFT_29493 [Aspergillus glaucus CBS 516.65]|uniref:Beta-ketoacyl synthase N-terminal domain-containing protein n=1 Tax=Aspergillus glaucus CBS 516.65 TaxID=1160497 RepID=A0A1L9V7N3_ASPGL|nr:hypothetical protein ASPGLDRAFT_29493 [Aspergillus glaucus CBS 516.65]OJJ79947.1 hypothetical protein ASPGLDRAFT_29493 [Aspergillus glaucus CBS 516.65]